MSNWDYRKPRTIIELIDSLKSNGVSPKEYRKYVNKFLEAKARENCVPMHGTFELTPLCNFNCKMCYVHLNNDDFAKGELLSISDWKELIIQAHNMGLLSASLTGGECLTYPDFDELYLFLREKGIKTSILTNGFLINQDRIDFFKRYPPSKIQITLYGSSEEAYETVTGKRAFHVVYQNILRLKETKIPMTIGITPNSYMVDDMYAIIETVKKLNVNYHINSFIFNPRSRTGRKTADAADFTADQYVEIYKYSEGDTSFESPSYPLIDLPEESHDGIDKYGMLCGGGRSTFTIKYDGEMSPCAALENISTRPLKIGFVNAWRKLNELVNAYPLPKECNNCIYYPYCFHCVALHKDVVPFGHCNPTICERTKKMISNGLIPFKENKEC